jgi:hypothetical protein
VDVEHLDPALAKQRDELVVLSLGLLYPQHVVEEQLVVVGWSEALETQVRAVNDYLLEPTDFGVHTER